MLHSGLVLKISEALRVGKGASLLFRDGGRRLHNATENVVGMVADSMGRSRTKLSAGTEERHGTTRVGPSTDVLQVTRSGTDMMGSGQEPAMEESHGFVMSDPNSSMWNLYKDRVEDAEAAASKIKRRISKMKEDIKHYYVERLEENQVLFAELEESFKIGKKNMGRKMLREEELEPVEVMVQAVHKPRKPLKSSILQIKQAESEDAGTPEERSPKGYRRFSSVKPDDKVTMRKRPQINQEATEAQEGLTEVGGVSPVCGNFRSFMPPTVKLIDGLPLLFRKPNFGCYRNFSSLTGPSTILARKDSAGNKGFQTTSNGDAKCMPELRYLPPYECDARCKLPKCPKAIIHVWPECEKISLCGCGPVHPRVYCDCLCLHADLPLAKRPDYICPSFSECKRKTHMNVRPLTECCDRLDRPKPCEHFVEPYVPFISALERQEKVLGRRYWTCGMQYNRCCDYHTSSRVIGFRGYHTSSRINGFRGYHTSSRINGCRGYHTTVRRLTEYECEDECARARRLCCHVYSPCPMGEKRMDKKRWSYLPWMPYCEKLCMPCCCPAREPPECCSTYRKQPCVRFCNPRPAFSECRRWYPFKHELCECEVPRKPWCYPVWSCC